MNSEQKRKNMYERVQIRLNTDPKLKNWRHREDLCRETYAKIVKREPAIMEWEVDYWGRFGKWGMPFVLTFLIGFLPLLLVHHIEIKNESDEYWTTMGGDFLCFYCLLSYFS